MSDVERLPDFVILGARRSATRWLRNNLAEHPDLYLPPRELGYFSDADRDGLRSYRLMFRDAGEARLCGECSPSYFRPGLARSVASQIETSLPDVRLVVVLRDPVDRLFSDYRDHVIHGRIPLDTTLLEALHSTDREIAALDLVGHSRYGELLHPYWSTFGDRLLVVLDEDIRSDPQATFDRVLGHVGAAPFTASRLDRVLYSNAASRWTEGREPTPEQRRVLYMLFRADVEELEAMIGRYVPEWDPGPPPVTWSRQLGVADPYLRSSHAAG